MLEYAKTFLRGLGAGVEAVQLSYSNFDSGQYEWFRLARISLSRKGFTVKSRGDIKHAIAAFDKSRFLGVFWYAKRPAYAFHNYNDAVDDSAARHAARAAERLWKARRR